MVILRTKEHALNSLYLYLFLRSKMFLSQIAALGTGSAQPQLPIRDINRVEIPIPPLPEQRAIAHILGTLDDKIELNRRMNQTLEEMARALFKSWFVDFDPVRAKIALKHHKSITPPPQANHSPLEGESASQGRQPEGEPVGGGKARAPARRRAGGGKLNASIPRKHSNAQKPSANPKATRKGFSGTTCARNNSMGTNSAGSSPSVATLWTSSACQKSW